MTAATAGDTNAKSEMLQVEKAKAMACFPEAAFLPFV